MTRLLPFKDLILFVLTETSKQRREAIKLELQEREFHLNSLINYLKNLLPETKDYENARLIRAILKISLEEKEKLCLTV